MNIEEFSIQYGYEPLKKIDILVDKWEWEKEVDGLIDDVTGSGIIVGDILIGDGIRDQISKPLLEGFSELQGDKVGTFDKVRERLVEVDERGRASLLALKNKIKGQIAENDFREAMGDHAYLAESGSC